jgi:hypothetical protein
MRTFFLLLLALLSNCVARAQAPAKPLPDSVSAFLDKSLALLQAHSLERHTVDWAQLRQTLYQRAQGAQSVSDLLPLYSFVFEQLKDDHGWLTYRGKVYKWYNKARAPYTNPAVESALAAKPGVQLKMLPGQVGYLQLPGINAGGSLEKQRVAAQVVLDSVCRFNSDKIKAWVVDLRLNDGGAMAPMLGGMAPLLGDGHLGGFIDQEGKPTEQWYLRNGDFYLDTLGIRTVHSQCHRTSTSKPIAVLLSGQTASSGEIVAISLKGRPATRFFGEPTYGATTANQSYLISGTAYLTIAGAAEADRNQVAYKTNVLPDELIIGGDNFTDLGQDTKVRAALSWLKTAKRKPSRR